MSSALSSLNQICPVEPMSPTENVVLSPMRSKYVGPRPVPKVRLFLNSEVLLPHALKDEKEEGFSQAVHG